MVDQLRELLRTQPFVPLFLQLTERRALNVYEPTECAVTSLSGKGDGVIAIAVERILVHDPETKVPRSVRCVRPIGRRGPWKESRTQRTLNRQNIKKYGTYSMFRENRVR